MIPLTHHLTSMPPKAGIRSPRGSRAIALRKSNVSSVAMSAAAIVGTVIFALTFQGIAALPGFEGTKPYLLPQQLDAWEALFGQIGVSVGRAAWTCALYTLVSLAAGWAIFARRDVAGARPVLLAGRS